MIQFNYTGIFEGLAMAVWAGVLLTLPQSSAQRLPWRWLALSALSYALHLMLSIENASGTAAAVLGIVHLAAIGVSLLALVEFGRRGLPRAGGPVVKAWTYAPLLVLASVGALTGQLGSLEATCRYALGLSGGFLAVVTLEWTARSCEGRGRTGLRVSAVTLLAYTLAIGLLVPRAPFFPAAGLNQETFAAILGISATAVQSLCALAVMVGLWLYRCHEADPSASALWGRRWLFPAASVLLIALGWLGAAKWAKADAAEIAARAAAMGEAAGAYEVVLQPKPGQLKFGDHRRRSVLPVLLGMVAAAGALITLCVVVDRMQRKKKPVLASVGRGRR